MNINKYQIRQAQVDDLDKIWQLEQEVWPEFPASRDMISKRIEIFPEGNIVAQDTDGRIVGYLVIMFIGHKASEFPNSWMAITGNGSMSTHNIEGEYMYGVTLTVAKGCGVGMELQVHGWAIAVKYRKKGCFLGSPIPGFAQYKKKHPEVMVEDYVFRLKRGRRPFDPELAYYSAAGFKAVRVLEEYEPDSKSLNYGVLVYCRNIFLHWPGVSVVAWVVKKFGFSFLKAMGVK